MSASVNKAIIIGNLGADPELRETGGGAPVCNFRVATNETWTDKSGERQERTEWHPVVAWGKLAELCAQYLKKGRSAYVEGKLQTREWEDREGSKRFTTEIVAQSVVFLGGAGGGQAGDTERTTTKPAANGGGWKPVQPQQPAADPFDAQDDIPF